MISREHRAAPRHIRRREPFGGHRDHPSTNKCSSRLKSLYHILLWQACVESWCSHALISWSWRRQVSASTSCSPPIALRRRGRYQRVNDRLPVGELSPNFGDGRSRSGGGGCGL